MTALVLLVMGALVIIMLDSNLSRIAKELEKLNRECGSSISACPREGVADEDTTASKEL